MGSYTIGNTIGNTFGNTIGNTIGLITNILGPVSSYSYTYLCPLRMT